MDFKKITPHLFVVLIFAVIAYAYCLPALQGEELVQHDNISWKGMRQEAKSYLDSTGINPQWSNSMFGGMPLFLTTNEGGDNNYTHFIGKVISTIFIKPAHFFFIAMLSFYVLMLTLRVNRWIGAIGAFAYAFATYNVEIIAAGHDTKMLAIGLLPGVLAGFLLLFKNKWLAGGALLALFSSLLFNSNHFQIMYYACMILGVTWIGFLISAVKEKQLKNFCISTGIALLVGALAFGSSAASFLPTLEYNKYSIRGGGSELTPLPNEAKSDGGLDKDYAFRWSNSIGETFCILVPYLYGGGSSQDIGTSSNTYDKLTSLGVPPASAEQYVANAPMYSGTQPFVSGPVYFGAIVCFLFVLGLIIVKSPHKYWIVAISVIAVVMSWGNNFASINYFLFDHLPMLNKLRTPSMILVIPQFMFAFLGFWGLNEIISGKISKEEAWKSVKLATIIMAGLAAVIALGSQMFMDFKGGSDDNILRQFSEMGGGSASVANDILRAIREDRSSLALSSGFKSAAFIVAAAALLWAFLKDKINSSFALAGLAFLVVIDLIPVDRKYLNSDNYQDAMDYEMAFSPRPVDQEILKDKDPYFRVLDITKDTYNDAIQAYHFKAVGGYHPAKMEIYQDLIERQMNQSTGFNAQVLDMLNTKYVIFPGPNNQATYSLIPSALGNAWFVENIKWVKTADEEMAALNANRLGDTAQMPNAFNAATTAIIRDDFKSVLSGLMPYKDSASEIKLTKYGLNTLNYTSSNSKEGFAVFSDIYYPAGWTATIDGKPADIVRVNYVLRGLKIPAGQHQIEFDFHPSSYHTGNSIAMICSLLVLACCAAALFFIFRKNKNQEVA